MGTTTEVEYLPPLMFIKDMSYFFFFFVNGENFFKLKLFNLFECTKRGCLQAVLIQSKWHIFERRGGSKLS